MTTSCPHTASQVHGCIQTHPQNNTHGPTFSATTPSLSDPDTPSQTTATDTQPHHQQLHSWTDVVSWVTLTDTHCHGQWSSKTIATSSHRHTASKTTVTDTLFQRQQLHAQTQTHPHRQHSLTHTTTLTHSLLFSHKLQGPTLTDDSHALGHRHPLTDSIHRHILSSTTILRPVSFRIQHREYSHYLQSLYKKSKA